MPTLVYLLEDDPDIARLIERSLGQSGFTTRIFRRMADFEREVRRQTPDLCLIDLALPDGDGLDLVSNGVLPRNVPRVIVTGRGAVTDRVVGLEIGADDYICKPFSPREVIARIGAVLRRHRHMPAPPAGPITIDEESCRATLRGQPLDLTPVEFRLLRQLHGAQGRVFSRDQLLNGLYNDHRIVTDRAVDSHVKNLRRKIADAGGSEDWIKSIYGVGYRMDC